MTGKPQILPPGCPYANKAGLVCMVLLGTGRVQAKTNLALYDVHLAQANGRFKKSGRAMTLEEAGRASLENEKALGWDKLPPLVHTIRPPDPALMTEKAKRPKAETAETDETASTRARAPSSSAASGSEGKAGGSRARAQPKASERSSKKKVDPIVAAARAKG